MEVLGEMVGKGRVASMARAGGVGGAEAVKRINARTIEDVERPTS